MRDTCPICAGARLRPIMRREGVPVHQNLLVHSAREARAIQRGTLAMVACERCGFAFNKTFDASLLNYGEAYENSQGCSAYFDDYMNGLARELVEAHGVRAARIVEVGCGKGHFLRKLVSYPGAANSGDGFDPSYSGPATELEGRLRFHRAFYDAAQARLGADVVVCRHVIEHVDDPLALLRHVRAALDQSPGARVFFETPCVEWILANVVLWDLFYEHCSLFTAASLAEAFARTGFETVSVEHRFGGQYLWAEARVVATDTSADRSAAGPTLVGELIDRYQNAERSAVADWRVRLRALRAEGPIAIWGAGAKGVTFANLGDPDCEFVDVVIDINPAKQGRFVPGTGHPIGAVAALGERSVRNAILMNPNYRDENLALISSQRIDTNLIDWT